MCIEKLTEPVKYDGQVDDLNALKRITSFVRSLRSKIAVNKPTPENEDMFGKISDKGMDELVTRFSNLDKILQKAQDSEPLKVAFKILRDEFGDDFPLDEDEPIGAYKKTKSPAIITSSSSA